MALEGPREGCLRGVAHALGDLRQRGEPLGRRATRGLEVQERGELRKEVAGGDGGEAEGAAFAIDAFRTGKQMLAAQ